MRPHVCGRTEVILPEEGCCDNLRCDFEEFKEDMTECCDEVKTTLGEHEATLEEHAAQIESIEGDIQNLEDTKVDKIPGKGLSTNDYTDAEKTKLAGIEAGAEKNVQSNWTETNTSSDAYILNKPTIDTQMSDTSTNAVQNKAIKGYIDNLIQELPADKFLDLTKTTFVQNFTWSSTTYPGSTNPNLNGKPVLVLAVTDGTNTMYSFLNVETLLNVYTGQSPITVNGTVISHDISGVSAGSKGDTQNQTPAFGGTFKALSETVDAKGHVTALSEHTVKIPDTEASSTQNGLMTAAQAEKLAGIQAGAEVNVQPDWNVTDTSSDAYIKNKPTIPSSLTAGTGIWIHGNEIERVPLIGEIVATTSSRTVGYHGGYERVSQDFQYQYLEDGMTWASGVSNGGCAILIRDKQIIIRFGFDAKITDDEMQICSIPYATLGLSGSPNQHFVGYCDGAHQVGMFRGQKDDSGDNFVIYGVDAVPHSETYQKETWHCQFVMLFGNSSMLDSACDRFYWRRTS